MIIATTLSVVAHLSSMRTPSALERLVSLVNEAGGQSSIHDYSRATLAAGVWASVDRSRNGRNHTQSALVEQPVISPAGALFDGINDNLRQDITGGTFSFILSFTKAGGSQGFLLSNQTGAERLRYQDGNALAWSAGMTVTVGSANTPTRDAFHDALVGSVVITVQNVAFSGDTQIQIGRSAGAAPEGTIRRMIVLDNAALGSNLAEAVTLARTVAALP